MYSIKMSKTTLKLVKVEVNKKEFDVSKQPIPLNLVNENHILLSDKFEHRVKGFEYFIGYKDDNIIRPLYIEDHCVLTKYNEIWNKIKKTLNIQFQSMPV